jgi:pimeloyl-ACP methyl ester carboxylesterase
VHVEDLPIDGDLTAYLVRGREHRLKMLFIPGMCVHPGGYVMAFQHTAASRGDLVTLQADVSCGGDGAARRWSSDLAAMERRIEAAFDAAELGEPRDVVIIGYSQGAERAERLVADQRWARRERYVAAILIASPIEPAPRDFAHAAAVVTMAGTRDAQEKMRGAVSPLMRAGIPSEFIPLPGAAHGQMGEDPEKSMSEALDFVEEKIELGRTSHERPPRR